MSDSAPTPSRLIRASALGMRWMMRLLGALLLVLLLAWVALQYLIVPRISEARPRLETWASEALGVPVRIAEIEALAGGLVPSFELRGVVLLDTQGRESLRLPRVLASVSLGSLFRLDFDQLYVDQPFLEVRRALDGRVYVAGLPIIRATTDADSPAADWFFSQHEFVIRQATVHLVDEQASSEPLVLTRLDFLMRNGVRSHDFRVDAALPEGWGERLHLAGKFRQPLLSNRPGRWTDWQGQAFADFSRVDIARVLPRLSQAEGVTLKRGVGALRVWADISKGELVGGVADVALEDASARLGAGLQPLDFRYLNGRIGGRWPDEGFEVRTEGLRFETNEGLSWPGGNVVLSYAPARGKTPAHGELRADRLDLAAISQIAGRLPLGTATHAVIAGNPVQGLVETVQARWQGEVASPQAYELRGRVSGFELRAAASAESATRREGDIGTGSDRPGVRGATVDLDLNQSGGKARVAISQGALVFPGAFEDPVIPLDTLSADAQWRIKGESIVVHQLNARFSNADAQGELSGTWQTAAGSGAQRFPGVLDLKGSFSRADGARVHRYLPLGIPADVRHYVRDSVIKGDVNDLEVRVKGDLRDIPFADGRAGEFRFSGKARDLDYAFVPRGLQPAGQLPWPSLTGLSGDLIFDRASMKVRGASARMVDASGLQLSRIEAHIPDFMNTTTVIVSFEARGPAATLLGVVNQSPIGDMTGKALTRATINGDATGRVRLNLPLATLEQSRVQGSVTLAGNDLRMSPDTPQLGKARGLVTFSDSGFQITGGQARMLGGDVRLEGGTRPAPPGVAVAGQEPPQVLLRAQGTVSAEGLRQATELGFFARLARHATGSTAFTGTLGFRGDASELIFSSNLQGLGLNLPPPLGKAADAVLPLRFENTLVARPATVPNASPQQDQLLVELGRLASVGYVRDISGPEPRVLRGSIGVGLASGEFAPMPAQGVAANINLGSLNVDSWEAVLSNATGVSMAGADPPRAGPSAAQTYFPSVVALRANELVVGGRTFHRVVIGGARDGATWRANLNADQINGYVEYRQPSGPGGGRVFARLSRLALAPAAARDVEEVLDQQPASIPALDIVVDDFELRGRRLGRVEVDAINAEATGTGVEPGTREWQLRKLGFAVPEATFTATGTWAVPPSGPAGTPLPRRRDEDRRRMAMNFRLDIGDSGALLARLGMKDVIRRGKGKIEGQIGWQGSPLSMDLPSLDGQFNLNVEAGQFLKADPGIAKLLGVLSLQSLPRRLTLDFRDVFSEGFAFDFIRGDVGIARGIASTNNLQMKGVNAAVLMEGSADIGRETQDLRVVVVPEIDAITASLVATAINPALGLGTVLAQLVLRRPLVQAATQEFRVDGTWADPRVTRVSRTAPLAPEKQEAARP